MNCDEEVDERALDENVIKATVHWGSDAHVVDIMISLICHSHCCHRLGGHVDHVQVGRRPTRTYRVSHTQHARDGGAAHVCVDAQVVGVGSVAVRHDGEGHQQPIPAPAQQFRRWNTCLVCITLLLRLQQGRNEATAQAPYVVQRCSLCHDLNLSGL